MTMMTRRLSLVTFAVVALLIGYAAGQFLFLPLLKWSFADWFKALIPASAAEAGTATLGFSVAFGCLWLMVPISALATERFARKAKYPEALAKSALIGLLAFGTAWLYQHEQAASLQRLAISMPQFFAAPVTQLVDNPLTKIAWFSAVCLVIFGPLDLWIARVQQQSRKRAQATAAHETAT